MKETFLLNEKNPVGRPRASFDLPTHWKESILNEYSQGASDVEIMALIHEWRGSFSRDLFGRWLDEETDFSETIKEGRLLAEAWWYRAGRHGLTIPRFSPALWFIQMKNRFGWRNEPSREVKEDDEPITFIKQYAEPEKAVDNSEVEYTEISEETRSPISPESKDPNNKGNEPETPAPPANWTM